MHNLLELLNKGILTESNINLLSDLNNDDLD
jgi:hypothetical protein